MEEVGKVGFVQLVAVINSLTESVEVIKWYDPRNDDSRRARNRNKPFTAD